MPRRDVIVIGASAGGVPALLEIVRGLPAYLPASLFFVLHVTPYSRSHLSEVLSRAGRLPAMTVTGPVQFRPGRIYVAPPDYHLELSETEVRVERGPREHRNRPSIDVLFRSAAALGPRVIGIVLTGILDDGTAGLAAIKQAGGIAIVQDPREAAFPDMPLNALRNVRVDYSLPLRAMPETLLFLLNRRSFRQEASENLVRGSRVSSMRKKGARRRPGARVRRTSPARRVRVRPSE